MSRPWRRSCVAAGEPPSLAAFTGYFLRLGTFGFGGPIALAGAMQRELVEERGWVTKEEYVNGLALAQLTPGPLAAQLAIYLGWARAGVFGATLVAVAFVLPSFVMVLAISIAYVRFGGLPWMQAAFYGIGAAVIAIILRSAYKLVRLTLGGDRLLWLIFAVNAVATAVLEAEVVSLIVGGGLVALLSGPFLRAAPLWRAAACRRFLIMRRRALRCPLLKAASSRRTPKRCGAEPETANDEAGNERKRLGKSRVSSALSVVPPLAFAASGTATAAGGGTLFWFFAKAGAFVFG